MFAQCDVYMPTIALNNATSYIILEKNDITLLKISSHPCLGNCWIYLFDVDGGFIGLDSKPMQYM